MMMLALHMLNFHNCIVGHSVSTCKRTLRILPRFKGFLSTSTRSPTTAFFLVTEYTLKKNEQCMDDTINKFINIPRHRHHLAVNDTTPPRKGLNKRASHRAMSHNHWLLCAFQVKTTTPTCFNRRLHQRLVTSPCAHLKGSAPLCSPARHQSGTAIKPKGPGKWTNRATVGMVPAWFSPRTTPGPGRRTGDWRKRVRPNDSAKGTYSAKAMPHCAAVIPCESEEQLQKNKEEQLRSGFV